MTLGEMGLSSAQMGGDNVPMGDNVPVGNASFAGMPTFTSEEDGAPAARRRRGRSRASSSALYAR